MLQRLTKQPDFWAMKWGIMILQLWNKGLTLMRIRRSNSASSTSWLCGVEWSVVEKGRRGGERENEMGMGFGRGKRWQEMEKVQRGRKDAVVSMESLPWLCFLHNTSVVHDDVKSAVLRKRCVKCFLPGLDIGDITGHSGDVTGWVGACYLVGELGVDVHDNNFGTFGCVLFCYCW